MQITITHGGVFAAGVKFAKGDLVEVTEETVFAPTGDLISLGRKEADDLVALKMARHKTGRPPKNVKK